MSDSETPTAAAGGLVRCARCGHTRATHRLLNFGVGLGTGDTALVCPTAVFEEPVPQPAAPLIVPPTPPIVGTAMADDPDWRVRWQAQQVQLQELQQFLREMQARIHANLPGHA